MLYSIGVTFRMAINLEFSLVVTQTNVTKSLFLRITEKHTNHIFRVLQLEQE